MKIKSTKIKLVFRLILLAIFTCGIIESSQATNYYVSTTGSDGNNGTTLGSAFLTIVKASQVASGGDIINVATGTYTGGALQLLIIFNT